MPFDTTPKRYYNHYINIDSQNRVTNLWSDGILYWNTPTEEDILISTTTTKQAAINNIVEPNLWDPYDMIPLWKYEGEEVLPRTEEEIEADRAAIHSIPPLPTQLDRIESQVIYTALMTDTLIEEV